MNPLVQSLVITLASQCRPQSRDLPTAPRVRAFLSTLYPGAQDLTAPFLDFWPRFLEYSGLQPDRVNWISVARQYALLRAPHPQAPPVLQASDLPISDTALATLIDSLKNNLPAQHVGHNTNQRPPSARACPGSEPTNRPGGNAAEGPCGSKVMSTVPKKPEEVLSAQMERGEPTIAATARPGRQPGQGDKPVYPSTRQSVTSGSVPERDDDTVVPQSTISSESACRTGSAADTLNHTPRGQSGLPPKAPRPGAEWRSSPRRLIGWHEPTSIKPR